MEVREELRNTEGLDQMEQIHSEEEEGEGTQPEVSQGELGKEGNLQTEEGAIVKEEGENSEGEEDEEEAPSKGRGLCG